MGMGTSVSTAVSERTAVIIEDYMFDATVAGELAPEESPKDFHDSWDLDGTDFTPEASPDDEGYWDDFSNIVTNGGFDTDSDWTLQSSWSISGGKASYDAVTTQHYLKQTLSSVAVGTTVKIQFDISDVQAGKNAFFKLEISGTPETVFTYTTFTEGTYTYYHTITGGLDRLNFVPLNTSTGGSFSIDNVTVTEYAITPLDV